jgi:arylsulfatase A-like enzyme
MRALVIGSLVMFGLAVVVTGARAADARPNIVFFLTDDQRYDALSLAGNALLKTPNMDRIGREGVWFRNAFVIHSLCAPSRSSFLTGKYSHTTGVIDNGEHMTLDPSQTIVTEILRKNGYEVAFIGKSHVKGSLRERTWDYYFGFKGQGRYVDPIISDNGAPDREYKGYMDDILTDKALEYLERPHEKPFCLFLWFKGCHRSWVRAPRFAHLYEGQTVPEPPTLKTGYAGKPKAVADADMKIGSFDDVKSLDQLVKDYDATLAAVDENVGRVLESLEKAHRAEDTAVIFSSDNGFFLGEWNFFDKRLMYEPSIRIPLLIRYPRRFQRGTVRSEIALNIDLAPTMLDLAGVPIPGDMHGKSLVPLAEGKHVPWRDAFLYEYYEYPQPHRVQPNRGIRTERWKLIHYFAEDPQEWELYDLQNDPNETENLYGRPEYADTTARLKERTAELRKETGDPDLGKN